MTTEMRPLAFAGRPEIKCLRCSWKITNSTRATSTTSMKAHPLVRHSLSESAQETDQGQETVVGGRTILKRKSIVSLF
jgi:hypothetical protein